MFAAEVLVNLAANRQASQSSTASLDVASNALNGKVDGTHPHGVCSHTTESTNPWWKVDLGRMYAVHDVAITTCKEAIGNDCIKIDTA